MSKNSEYPDIFYTQAIPSQLFSREHGYDPELSRALVEQRYKYDPNTGKRQTAIGNSFGKNKGAVGLYDKDTNKIIAGPFSHESNKIDIERFPSTFGHSERLGMLDILNHYIQYYQNMAKEGIESSTPSLATNIHKLIYDYLTNIEPPSYYASKQYLNNNKVGHRQIPNDLYDLYNDSAKYKNFLEDANTVVKMLSERQDCNHESDFRGGKCQSFIKNILPKGSSYGYLVERGRSQDTAIDHLYNRNGLFNAYQKYMNSLGREQELGQKPLIPLSDGQKNKQISLAIAKNRQDALDRLRAKKQRINPPPGTSISTSGSPVLITPYSTPDSSTIPSSGISRSMTSSSTFPGSQPSHRLPSFNMPGSSMSTLSSPSSFSSSQRWQNPPQSPTPPYRNTTSYVPVPSNRTSFSNPSYTINSPGNYPISSSLSSTMFSSSLSPYQDPFLPPDPQIHTNQPIQGYSSPLFNNSLSSTSSSSSSQPYQRRKRGGVIGRLLNSYNYL